MPPAHETLGEITGFLERFRPFSDLADDALAALAEHAEIAYFPSGTEILAQEGTPSEHLYIVRRGAVELLDEGEVVDVLEEGEPFGHPSLLSSLPPAFAARAREDALCYLFPAAATLRALVDPAGVRFLAASLESRLQQGLLRAHRTTPWGTAHAGVLAREAVVCTGDTPVRDVARRMTDADRPCAVVGLPDGLGLVTDRNLRERVASGEVPLDAPVSAVARAPAPSVASDRLALDALVDMLEAGVEHLVVVDGRGALVGVVDQAALLDVDVPSPVLVRQAVLRAADVEDVARAVSSLPLLGLRLLDASVEAPDVLDVLTTITDAATRRLADLAIAQIGEPPAPWAWLTLGSAARREQSLATDQDNGLGYEGGPEADGYFEAFAQRLNSLLARCGYAECRAGVMARNPGWRLTSAGWIGLYETWLRTPTRRNVHLAMIGADVRGRVGPLDLERKLHALLETVPQHTVFLEQLARATVALRPPLGFLRDLVVERSGEHVGTLDIKAGGVLPIVNLARLHALSAGFAGPRTSDRLRAAAARGRISPEAAQELQEAFVTVSRVRLEHQAAQVERGLTPDSNVDPAELPPLERRQLKEAFRAVARAQRAVDTRTATRIP